MTLKAAVVFDLSGTLTTAARPLDPDEPWRRYAEVAAPGAVHALVERLREAEHQAFVACRDEQRSFTFARILELAGADLLPDAVAAYRRCWDPYTQCAPEAPDVLRAIRARGLRIGLLSNTFWPVAWHQELLLRDGLLELFDAIVFSSELTVAKPHPEAFTEVLTRLGGVAPDDSIFVGDRLFEDIGGAQAAGMRTVALPERTVAAQHRIAAEVEPMFRIAQLTEVLAILDVWRSTQPTGGG